MQVRLASEKVSQMLGEYERVHEVSEVLHTLDIVANILLTAAAADPHTLLFIFIEQKLHIKHSLYSRTVTIYQ